MGIRDLIEQAAAFARAGDARGATTRARLALSRASNPESREEIARRKLAFADRERPKDLREQRTEVVHSGDDDRSSLSVRVAYA